MTDARFGAFPTHPGELIKDEIECRSISQRRLAQEIGMSHTALNEILNGKRSVTTQTAYLIEAALDVPAQMLLNMQMLYDMQTTQANKPFMERLACIRKVAAML